MSPTFPRSPISPCLTPHPSVTLSLPTLHACHLAWGSSNRIRACGQDRLPWPLADSSVSRVDLAASSLYFSGGPPESPERPHRGKRAVYPEDEDAAEDRTRTGRQAELGATGPGGTNRWADSSPRPADGVRNCASFPASFTPTFLD